MFLFEITPRKGPEQCSPHTNLNQPFPPAPAQMGGHGLRTAEQGRPRVTGGAGILLSPRSEEENLDTGLVRNKLFLKSLTYAEGWLWYCQWRLCCSTLQKMGSGPPKFLSYFQRGKVTRNS